MKAQVSRKRHIVKTITWRIIASATTFLLAWLFFLDDAKAVEKRDRNSYCRIGNKNGVLLFSRTRLV